MSKELYEAINKLFDVKEFLAGDDDSIIIEGLIIKKRSSSILSVAQHDTFDNVPIQTIMLNIEGGSVHAVEFDGLKKFNVYEKGQLNEDRQTKITKLLLLWLKRVHRKRVNSTTRIKGILFDVKQLCEDVSNEFILLHEQNEMLAQRIEVLEEAVIGL